MTQKKATKDEFFIVKLYEEAGKLGDFFKPLDRYFIGQLIGQNDRSVDNMVRMLAQTNFIKKGEGNLVYMTRQGEAFVKEVEK